MARMVMCNATKEKGCLNDFIKIKGKYYKSQEVYDNFMIMSRTPVTLVMG